MSNVNNLKSSQLNCHLRFGRPLGADGTNLRDDNLSAERPTDSEIEDVSETLGKVCKCQKARAQRVAS